MNFLDRKERRYTEGKEGVVDTPFVTSYHNSPLPAIIYVTYYKTI